MYDHADVIAALKHVKVKATDEVLSELASQLEAEALGLAETNTCKDWRIIEEQPV
jgi:hypothetical protein